jgi:hypothetical protein
VVWVCTLFEEEFAEAPVSVERGSVEVEVFAEGRYGFTLG